MNSCAVIGGGMLGMAAALRLARRGFAVTLYEADQQLGGLAAPWKLGPVTWDRHYHVILPSDDDLLALIRDLGLESEIVWRRVRSNFFIDGTMQPFTTLADHLRFPALGVRDKWRLATSVRAAQRRDDWRYLETISVEAWLRESSGDRVFERIWRPLLRAKLGDAYERCNAAFIWATIQRLYVAAQRHGAQRFGYVRGGYRSIVKALSAALLDAGVRVHLATGVRAISSVGARALAVETENDAREFDSAVVTLPAPVAARICRGLSGEERERLAAIEYQGVVCTSLLLDRPLGNAYITNIADERIPFTAVIEMTALVDPTAFNGRHLAYLPRYCTPRDPFFIAGDSEIHDRAVEALRVMYPGFAPSSVRALRVSRVPNVMPLPVIGYSGRIPGFQTSLPGLYLANSAQIVNGTLNVNETLELASRAIAHVSENERSREGAGHVVR